MGTIKTKRPVETEPEMQREYNREWRKANPEKVREYGRKYRATHPENLRAAGRRYYAANRETVREKDRKLRAEHPDKLNARRRAWCAANPELQAALQRRVNLKRYGLTIASYEAMLKAQGGGCAICHQPCSSGRRLAVDHCHATRVVRGLLCGVCNTTIGRFSDSPEKLRAVLRYMEKHSQLRLVKN